MPTLPTELASDEALTRPEFNTMVEAAKRVYQVSGGKGINIQQHPSALIISTPNQTIEWVEPAHSVWAKNVGAVNIAALDACQITLPLHIQGPPYDHEGTPVNDPANSIPYLYKQRCLEVYPVTDTCFGRFAIAATRLVAGEFGKVWIDGVCICRLTQHYDTYPAAAAEWGDRADTMQGQPYLIQSDMGGAQVLFVWRPRYPSLATDPRLALIRFDSRNTSGVGHEERYNPVRAGVVEVLKLMGATVTVLHRGIVEVTI